MYTEKLVYALKEYDIIGLPLSFINSYYFPFIFYDTTKDLDATISTNNIPASQPVTSTVEYFRICYMPVKLSSK